MKISHVTIKNFRRLQDVEFTLEEDNTLFVGPNNSGKTSVTAAFRLFFRQQEFTVNDFCVACIKAIDDFGRSDSSTEMIPPKIVLDIWFKIDPNKIEFGRAFTLLSSIDEEPDSVGIRMSFETDDADKMRKEFYQTFSSDNSKTLSEYLILGKNLTRYYSIHYYALSRDETEIIDSFIVPEEGRRILNSLIRLDYIDAQRNMHDEDTGRHNKLSSAFAAYYKYNLEKPSENEEAIKVIDENNKNLNIHYDKHFAPLLRNILRFGVPSVHDRSLKIVSSLSPQQVLQGSTVLYYEDPELNHRLPETYNGLGYKNLIYIAIQVNHFYQQWRATEINRPLLQIIFIEEPEVHLHAQVQQVFISHIYAVLHDLANTLFEVYEPPQIVITTHSSQIVDTVDFVKIRYFRRSPLKSDDGTNGVPLIATKILNLQDFHAAADSEIISDPEPGVSLESTREASRKANLHFLKKYMKLTHCDLFFADAAILIEGTVEKLLLPQMIEFSASELKSNYITILEVGGAYAHKFSSLMKFLGIPYVIVTDIDTVDPNDARRSCPAFTAGCRTSNSTLKSLLGRILRDEIVAINYTDQIIEDGNCFITFQRPVKATFNGAEVEFHGRTFEETFVYENIDLFREKKLPVTYDFAQESTLNEIASKTYETIKKDTFKKTEFALGVAAGSDWVTPEYISNGLTWLVEKLKPQNRSTGY